ncbi:mitochondrial distribution and morphology protein family 31/32 [Syncephalis fuscata]|nr:mitochondrial distribution and morphology protein family 31/32 [Syncephalis fuscata]
MNRSRHSYDQPLLSIQRRWSSNKATNSTTGPSYHGSVKLLLPPSPPVPSRRDMLKDVHGFFPRAYAHIKYTLMKRHRPWSADDILALFSWIFMSNAAFILVGTTTFASLLLALANSLQIQEFIAQRVGEYLTYETGVQFVFESAIVPNWRDGKIRLRNVILTRGPQKCPLVDSTTSNEERAIRITNTTTTSPVSSLDRETSYGIVVASPLEMETDTSETVKWDTNLTMFHLAVDQVEVTLNMMRWFDGKGLLEHVNISGVRGVIDRSHVFWDSDVPYIPSESRHISQPGDFELNSFSVNDLLVTVIQPGGFRPFKVSVISGHASRLRKRWLFYDLLSADSVVGVFDDCLFSMHRAQRPAIMPDSSLVNSLIASNNNSNINNSNGSGKQTEQRMSELRVDGINIDHLNAGVTGPFGWITSATVDLSAHITFPTEPEDDLLAQLLTEWVERVDAMAAARRHIGAFHDDLVATIIRSTTTKESIKESALVSTADTATESTTESIADTSIDTTSKVIIDLSVRFNNVKASVPLVAEDLSYLNNALIRPVVAYMNWHRTCIPVRCSIGIDLNEFDGAWTVYEAGLVDIVSEHVGRALVQLTTDERERNRRLKRVGLWGLQSVTRNLISVVDYARGAKGFWEYTGLVGSN